MRLSQSYMAPWIILGAWLCGQSMMISGDCPELPSSNKASRRLAPIQPPQAVQRYPVCPKYWLQFYQLRREKRRKISREACVSYPDNRYSVLYRYLDGRLSWSSKTAGWTSGSAPKSSVRTWLFPAMVGSSGRRSTSPVFLRRLCDATLTGGRPHDRSL